MSRSENSAVFFTSRMERLTVRPAPNLREPGPNSEFYVSGWIKLPTDRCPKLLWLQKIGELESLSHHTRPRALLAHAGTRINIRVLANRESDASLPIRLSLW
jgi:hypothetical protein